MQLEMVRENMTTMNPEMVVTQEAVEATVTLGLRCLVMAQTRRAGNHPVPPRQATMFEIFGRILIDDSVSIANDLGLSFNPGLRTRAQLALNS